MWEIVGKIADVASLFSLAVSGYAAWQITVVKRKISRQLVFNFQADNFIREVRDTVDRLKGIVDRPDVDVRDFDNELRLLIEKIYRVELVSQLMSGAELRR